jgi:hypothetical protein
VRFINLRAAGLAILFTGGGLTVSAAVVVSNFNTNLDGWTLAYSDLASTLTYVSSGGNPGGYIVFSDGAQGANDVFSAPAKFLGNDSAFVNGSMSFDLAHNEISDDLSISPLVITDGSGDTLSLIITAPATSTSPYVWTSYNLALNTSTSFVFDGVTNNSEGFTPSGGTVATQNQINAVLGNVSSISVPADLHNGTELTGLDNFSLSSVPEPSSWGILAGALATLFAVFRRRAEKIVQVVPKDKS